MANNVLFMPHVHAVLLKCAKGSGNHLSWAMVQVSNLSHLLGSCAGLSSLRAAGQLLGWRQCWIDITILGAHVCFCS